MANKDVYLQLASTDAAYQINGGGGGGGPTDYILGNNVGFTNDTAVRFPNIQINQGVSVNSAEIRLYAGANGHGNINFTTYGIKETNTANFSSSPFGRPKTSASSTDSIPVPGVGNFMAFGVTSQVNEILGQGGWASGNAMGFLCFNNQASSGTAAWLEDDFQRAQLLIQVSAPGNFTPTPGTVTVGALPASQNYGIKVSQPSQDVKTATDAQTYYTSRKKELRVSQEYVAAGTTSQVAHGLSYAPSVLGYYNNGGTCRIMNVPSNMVSVEEYIASDATNVYYFLQSTETGYLYIFIDPLT